MKTFKHEHGTLNPILAQEETAILLATERALASSPNSQTIGRNGEMPFLKFLQRYLPMTLRAVSGHFITPSGVISPQLDVIIVDSRYPLLAENADQSVLVMLHSVLVTFEIKTNLTTKDVSNSLLSAKKIELMAQEIPQFGTCNGFSFPQSTLLAYNCKNRLEALEQCFFSQVESKRSLMDAILLRYHPKDRALIGALGGELHLEPPFPDNPAGNGSLPGGYFPISRPSHTPLSDLYYSLVQNCYYILGARDFAFSVIAGQFDDYMNWSTAIGSCQE